MKIVKYISFVIIVLTYMSCVSLKGNKYYSVYTNYPSLTMVFLNDSTSVLYYANSSVAKIRYSIDTLNRSKGFIGSVKHVEIFDTLIYDYRSIGQNG